MSEQLISDLLLKALPMALQMLKDFLMSKLKNINVSQQDDEQITAVDEKEIENQIKNNELINKIQELLQNSDENSQFDQEKLIQMGLSEIAKLLTQGGNQIIELYKQRNSQRNPNIGGTDEEINKIAADLQDREI
jgi:hypothetical protein